MTIPSRVRARVDSISPLSDETWQELVYRLAPHRYVAREYICPAGSVARDVGLLVNGWVRAYLVTEEGREFTKHLFAAPGIVGDYASLLTGAPVRIAQQSLTPCEVLAVPWADVTALAEERRDLERLLRRYAELSYLAKEEREIELATLPASERYERVLVRYPGIEQALPQYEIAAYLAITPTQLSRIRARRVARGTAKPHRR